MSLSVNAQAQNFLASIKKQMEASGITNPTQADVGVLKFSAESTHSPEDGIYSGLDADEIAILGELSPELKAQYEAMAKSDVNKENLARDLYYATVNLESAQNDYNEKYNNTNNWFLNIFRSQETKEQLQSEFNNAKERLDYAQAEYDGDSSKVISYYTLLQRNGGMKFDN